MVPFGSGKLQTVLVTVLFALGLHHPSVGVTALRLQIQPISLNLFGGRFWCHRRARPQRGSSPRSVPGPMVPDNDDARKVADTPAERSAKTLTDTHPDFIVNPNMMNIPAEYSEESFAHYYDFDGSNLDPCLLHRKVDQYFRTVLGESEYKSLAPSLFQTVCVMLDQTRRAKIVAEGE